MVKVFAIYGLHEATYNLLKRALSLLVQISRKKCIYGQHENDTPRCIIYSSIQGGFVIIRTI